jgi:F-type H+-transporting ATPase subunit epsilon
MNVEVVSPEKNYYTGEATMVISRTPNGEIGILDNHEPTVATLLPGGLTIENKDNRTSFAISGGVLQITGEKVIVLGELVEEVAEGHESAVERGKALAKQSQEL